MPRLLSDAALERSSVVANCAMNRERRLDGYLRELGIDVIERGRWLDLCCGTGRALADAAAVLPDVEIVGVDLVDHLVPRTGAFRLVTASVTTWRPEGRFDLVTCVHGLHYIGDKLGLLIRAASWLAEDGLLVANFDAGGVRLADGTPAGRRLITALRRAGFTYDSRRRRISLRGRRTVDLPYRYLGADDRAGPNYTGQPAVHSFYEHTDTEHTDTEHAGTEHADNA